jgi:hypothetical protein
MKHVKLFEQFINEKKNWRDFSSTEIAKSFMKDYDKSADSDDLDSWLDEFAFDKKIEAGLDANAAKAIVDELKAKGYKNLKHEDLRINEAMKVNPTGDRFGSYDLEAAGVEVPNFRIDLTSLRNRRLEIIEKFRNITSLRKALIVDPTLSIDKKKIEKDLENAVKAFNADSKKAYQEFEKVLKAVKFPDDAKFTVEFEVDPKGEFFPSYSEAFMDFDQKDPVKLFMAWIKPTYYYLAPRKRNEQRWRTASSWAGMIEGRIDPGFLKTAVVPPILDRDFILMNFLNSSNTLDR